MLMQLTETSEALAAYDAWIAERVKEYADAYGKCGEVTEEMQAEFPELRRVRGFYHCPMIGQRTHWWLMTEDNIVVDPTKRQFPSGGLLGDYEELADDELEDRVPTGPCMECGEPCFKGATFCSDECGDIHVAWMNAGCLS